DLLRVRHSPISACPRFCQSTDTSAGECTDLLTSPSRVDLITSLCIPWIDTNRTAKPPMTIYISIPPIISFTIGKNGLVASATPQMIPLELRNAPTTTELLASIFALQHR